MKKLLCAIFLSAICLGLRAQDTKQEQEQKIKIEEVPQKSKRWVRQAFPGLMKVKWYRELTSGKTSYEAKFKYEGQRYSVEFDEGGAIEDVERRVKESELAADQKARLYLGFSQLNKFSLVKIQEQWTAASSSDLIRAIQMNDTKLVTIRYEVEFKAEIDGNYTLWEGLFGLDGQLISKRQVVLRPTDNLDYD